VRTNILDADRNWPDALGEEPPSQLGSDIVIGLRAPRDRTRHAACRRRRPRREAVEADRFWVCRTPTSSTSRGSLHDIAEHVNPRTIGRRPAAPGPRRIAEEVIASLS